MYCLKCGTKIPDAAQFCPGCGADVAELEAALDESHQTKRMSRMAPAGGNARPAQGGRQGFVPLERVSAESAPVTVDPFRHRGAERGPYGTHAGQHKGSLPLIAIIVAMIVAGVVAGVTAKFWLFPDDPASIRRPVSSASSASADSGADEDGASGAGSSTSEASSDAGQAEDASASAAASASASSAADEATSAVADSSSSPKDDATAAAGLSAKTFPKRWHGTYEGHTSEGGGGTIKRSIDLSFDTVSEGGQLSGRCNIGVSDTGAGAGSCSYRVEGTVNWQTGAFEVHGTSWINQGDFANMRRFSGTVDDKATAISGSSAELSGNNAGALSLVSVVQ